MDPVTPELEIIQGQLKNVGIDVTVEQLREVSVADRVAAEQWAVRTRKARSEKKSVPSIPPVVKRWSV